MEENRRKMIKRCLLPEVITIAVAVAGVYFFSILVKQNTAVAALQGAVMTAIGFAVTGFFLRQELLERLLDYDNDMHTMRYWIAVWGSLALSFLCALLPEGGWPFLPVFVILSLFSNLSCGVLTSAVLLMIPVFLSGASTGVFFLYFVSGVFAVGLFQHLDKEFTIGIPWILSMLCLLVCETANIVLVANERLSLELFLVPGANLILSGVLLLLLLKWFSQAVIFRDRLCYLELNDTANQTLADYRKQNKAEYFLCVHTAYFCERIAVRLSLDADALKCAGLYHKKYQELQKQEIPIPFPEGAAEILKEYCRKEIPIKHRETAVLFCCDAVVSSILYLMEHDSDKKLDYDQIIDAVFKKIQEKGTLRSCNITIQELLTMQKTFKEEKLYYDFLR